ncbi:MAG: hypothetical protein JOZ20_06365 [Sphingomonas sp.]|nr:hypothetical protein [Sphingomonas sp.]
MNRIPMSTWASALLRALIARSRAPRDRILLSDIRSTDWQSLTFDGERHEIELRVPGPNSREIVDRMCDRLEDAEFAIPGVIVADIRLAEGPALALDGSTTVKIEALTIAAD